MMLSFMASQGFVAQKKKNGTNTPIFTNCSQVIFKTRHGDEEDHKQWAPNKEHIKFFKQFGPKWTVFTAELLHSKTTNVKDELFIHDVLVWQGEYLIGSTFKERQHLLMGIVHSLNGKDEGDQYRVHKHVTIAKVFGSGFKQLFENLKPEDEGLVFKRPDGVLVPCIADEANSHWMARCRIPWTAGSF
jgi:hypothetical protein